MGALPPIDRAAVASDKPLIVFPRLRVDGCGGAAASVTIANFVGPKTDASPPLVLTTPNRGMMLRV
jgi:hypothetical protein